MGWWSDRSSLFYLLDGEKDGVFKNNYNFRDGYQKEPQKQNRTHSGRIHSVYFTSTNDQVTYEFKPCTFKKLREY
jgi:hypothetical protein